jgi:hypothetical protein
MELFEPGVDDLASRVSPINGRHWPSELPVRRVPGAPYSFVT